MPHVAILVVYLAQFAFSWALGLALLLEVQALAQAPPEVEGGRPKVLALVELVFWRVQAEVVVDPAELEEALVEPEEVQVAVVVVVEVAVDICSCYSPHLRW